MKNFHPFFAIGTFGTIITAILHMFMALGLSVTSSHTSFFAIYPIFITFLFVGVALKIKAKNS